MGDRHNAPLQLRALSEKEASRQLQAVVRLRSPILNTKLKNYSAPATTQHTNVNTGSSPKSHFVWINTSVEKLIGRVNQRCRRVHRVYANLRWAVFRQEISRTIEIELVTNLVLAVTPMRLDDFQHYRFFNQFWCL